MCFGRQQLELSAKIQTWVIWKLPTKSLIKPFLGRPKNKNSTHNITRMILSKPKLTTNKLPINTLRIPANNGLLTHIILHQPVNKIRLGRSLRLWRTSLKNITIRDQQLSIAHKLNEMKAKTIKAPTELYMIGNPQIIRSRNTFSGVTLTNIMDKFWDLALETNWETIGYNNLVTMEAERIQMWVQAITIIAAMTVRTENTIGEKTVVITLEMKAVIMTLGWIKIGSEAITKSTMNIRSAMQEIALKNDTITIVIHITFLINKGRRNQPRSNNIKSKF